MARSTRTRKRKKNGSLRAKLTCKRNHGEAYMTKNGKKIEAKVFIDEPCKCRRICSSKISCEERKHIFKSFWKMGNFKSQNAFICGLIQQSNPKSRRPRDASRMAKCSTNSFFLNIGDKSIKVCKTYFLKTLQVSDGRMTRALKKIKTGQVPGSDDRGLETPSNVTPTQTFEKLKEHISSFPAYQSHYTRERHSENTKFLNQSLNIRLMYNLYKEKYKDNPVTEAIYRYIFNNEFNLRFHHPNKDTCTKCDIFKMKIATAVPQEKNGLMEEHNEHLSKAEKARSSLKEDTELSKNVHNSVYCLTFDLEKALPVPTLTCSIAYYKRFMYVYNFGIHECSSDVGYMHLWDETIASRGSQEVASCLFKHINENCTHFKQIVMYSDACTGQNRNIKLALVLLRLVQDKNNSIQIIDHKFMTSGHSFLPNDADFGVIEMKAKKKVQYGPSDWYNIISSAKNKKPFVVTKMNQNDFFSTKNMENYITQRKKNTEGHSVNWLKIQWLRYNIDHPHSIFYKESLEDAEDFKTFSIKPARKGKPAFITNIGMPKLYTQLRPVTEAKKKDMMDLLPYIPPLYHQYFLNLKVVANLPEEDLIE